MTLFKVLWREPFAMCFGVVAITIVLQFDHLSLWTAPIALAVYVATGFADTLWQHHIDARNLAGTAKPSSTAAAIASTLKEKAG